MTNCNDCDVSKSGEHHDRCPSRKYAIEHTGTWYGVEIPTWLRCFDCRADNAAPTTKTPWGSSVWGSERAEIDLGLRGQGVYNATTPVSCSTYTDSRKASDNELATQIRRAIEEATRLRDEYEAAKPAPKGAGGSCLYRPAAITISNFGWSVVSDCRTCVVRTFGRVSVSQ